MYRERIIKNFLRYLTDNGVSSSSLRFYKSDIVNFLNWANGRKINKDLVNEYINSQRLITPVSTLNRRLSTIRSFANYLGENFMDSVNNINSFKKVNRNWQEALLTKLENKPRLKKVFSNLFFNRPSWYKKYHSYALSSYIHVAILILFTSISGYAIYDQVFSTADSSYAFPSSLTRPNRYLSFQGRLTDDLGNPETVATNVVFKLYDVSTGGTELWSSGTCSITPDQDGIFSTLLGSSCGSEIASSVFSENAAIWLGVTVGADTEATPRIQIATVAYALNAETLQGFPAGTGTSTIPYINSSGVVVLANASPKIQSTSGTFAVEGQALTLTTPDTTNGSITINPDGTGTLNLTFEGTAAGGGANGFVNATNANITSGSLYSGTVASNATGYNFINFLSGTSPTSKFSIDSTGLTNVGADLYVTSGISTFGTAVSDGTVEATKFCTGDGETNCVTDFSSLGGGGSLFTDGGDVTYLTSTTDDFAIGGSTLAASMFGIDVSSGNFYFGYNNAASPTLNFEASDGDAGEFGFNTSDQFFITNANFDVSGHMALGANSSVNGGALLYPSSSYTNILSIQEEITNLASLDYVQGVTNYLKLNPSGAVDASVYGIDNEIHTDSSNAANYSTIYGDYNDVYHAGSGTITSVYASTNQAYKSSAGGVITNATASYNYVDGATNIYGVRSYAQKANTYQPNTAGTIYGGYFDAQNTLAVSTGTDNNYGNYVNVLRTGATGGTINTYGQYINVSSLDNAGAGTHNAYGLYVSNVTGADNNYGIYSNGGTNYLAGNTGIGTNNPTQKLYVANGNIGISNSYGLLGDNGSGTHLYSLTRNNAIDNASLSISAYGGIGFGVAKTTGPEASTGFSMYINTSGNVGMGVTSPETVLHVKNATTDRVAIFESGDSDAYIALRDNTTTSNTSVMIGATGDDLRLFAGASVSERIRVLGSNGNVGIGTIGPDAKLDSLATSGEQLRLTYTDGSVYSGFTTDSSGYLIIDPTGARIALDGALQVGGTSPLAYSRLGTATTGHAGNISASNDLLISGDFEVDGTFFLDGGTISNSAGTASIVLSSSVTDTANTLSASNWLVENTANVGQAALMINNTKSGDLLTASASGTTKFTVQNDGDVLLTNQLQLGNLSSTPTALGGGSMFFNTTTNTNQCYNGTNWYNCGGTLYSNTNSVADGAYITVTHNLANSDLLSNAWIDTHGSWKLLDATYKPAIAWEGKDTQKGVYHNNINTYIQGSEGGAVSATLHEGLIFDTFEDSTKTDSANTTVSTTAQTGDDGSANYSTLDQRIQSGRVGLMGGQTYSTSTTDNDGQTYLGSNTVNDMYYYDRAKDSVPEVLVELGIDPNWYNGVTLSVATSSASYSQNGTLADKNPNLTTSYNGSLIKATGTDTTPRTIYITIKSPTTFDWTNYQGDSATGVTITPGTAQALGSTGVSATFTGGVSYNVGDVFKISSWYIEAESATRGAKQQFPERSHIIATAASVDIIDADTQKLWMRFSNGTNYIFGPTGNINSTTALNGRIYGGNPTNGLRIADLSKDRGFAITSGNTFTLGAVSQRNTDAGSTANPTISLVTTQPNDIAAAVIPNQPTQEVTVSGWGYIQGAAATTITETVNLPYNFNNSPTVITTVAASKATTAPNSLSECTAANQRIAGIAVSITNSSFVQRLSSSDAADGNFSTTTYYCYTWTATGTVSPKQFVAVATGATGADGGTTVINETDGTKVDVFIGSQHASAYRQTKVDLTNSGDMYLITEDATTPRNTLDVYYGVAGLASSEASLAQYRSGLYRVNTPAGWSTNGPTILGPDTVAGITSLKVSEKTSTVNSQSNTIFIGSTSGVSVIQENQGMSNFGDGSVESGGSVKYYTKDYISEEMIGDIRGMWPLNNANASSDFEDISIKANTLTGTNITAAGDSVSGVRGTATDFDGSTEYMSCTDAACGGTTKLDFAATTSFSYGAWFKTSATGAFQTVLSKKETNTGLEAGYSLYINDTNQVVCRIADGTNGASATSTQTFTNGNWNHAACVVDRGASLIYLIINGQITASASTSSVTSTLDNATIFSIGSRNAGNLFNGAIDEAFVTANTVSASQIKNMYQVGYRALQSHSTGLGGGAADTNQQLGGTTNTIGVVAPDYNNQYMYVGSNSTTLGALSKIQLNSDTNIKTFNSSANVPTGGSLLVDEDVTSLAVGETLLAAGSAASGVKSVGFDDYSTSTSGNFVSKTFTLPKNIGSAVLWVSPILDSSDGSNTLTVQASNDGGSNYTTCTLVGTDTNRSVPEREYACTFSTADNDLKVRFQFARGSTKTNTYVTEYGISWLGETGFRVEQADNNNVRLYNFSGETQNLKLNVTGASTAALANPWTDAGSYLYASGYETLRIYDGAGTNYLGLSHDGTLANLTYNGTTVLSINSTGDLLPNTDDTQSLGSNTKRWKDLFVGGETIHIGTSLTDEGTIAYDTTSNIFQFDTDSTTNGDIAFFTDDLYLDKSSGNIGIGTTAPVFKFEVNSGAAAPSSIDLAHTLAIGTGNANGTSKYLGQIGFVSRDVNFTAPKLVAYISAEATENYAADIDTGSIMRFFTGANDGTSPVERMAIDNNGNIGIGITGQSNQRLRINAPSTLTAANNYGLFISGDQSTANTGNHVGINLNPTYSAASGNTLQGLQGIVSTPQNTSSGTVNYMYGINTVPQNSSTGTVTNMIGTHSVAQKTGTGAVTTAVAGWFRVDNTNATGTLTNAYALYIDDSTETGTITNDYGLYQVDASALNYFAGNLGVGTNSPSTVLHARSASDTWVLTLQDSDGTCSINPESGGLSTACVSDARLKSNIVDAKPMLDTLLATKIRDYTVNASGNRMTGTIAQEMQVSNPDMVVQGDDGYLRVKEFSSWQIIKGIQEVYRSLTDQIIALQNQVNSQQNNNSNNIISPVANSDLIIDLSPEQSASRLVIKGINDEEVASIDAQGKVTANNLEINNDATVSGTLYADNIESQRLEDIEELLREVELNQGLLAESQTWETNPSADSAEFASLIASSLQTNDLFVTGQAAISSLFVSDLLTANKIESLDMPLQIQSLAAAPLEIMAGKITIDTNGNTKFLGNVEIAGDLKINNIIVANNVDPLATESGSIIEGQVVSNSTAGKATLKANSESIKINNNKVSLNTLIYITPITSTQNKVLYVKSKDTGFFEVGFSDTLDTDVEFNWWIIDLEGNTIIE